MLKKMTTLVAFAAAVGMAATAYATTVAGRVTSVTPTSIAVFDKEVVTVNMNGDTKFTRLINAKPWQADTTLTFNAVSVGRYVIVHEDWGIANWVQVDMDRPLFVEYGFTTFTPIAAVPPAFMSEAARHRAEAATLRAAPNASESKRPGSPGTAAHCDRIAARLDKAAGVTAPADVTANPAAADRESAEHRAEARARRAAPNASESKRPGSPDTALHCDRIADKLEKSGK
jgi:hypothetical protein